LSTEPQVVSTQRLEVVHGDTERRQDHDVVPRDPREVEPLLPAPENLDPHVAQLSVHVRVVNDLPHEHDPPVRKLAPRLIRVLDGPLDPVTEPELPRQPHRHPTGLEGVLAGAQKVHQPPGIIGVERLLDLRLEPKAPAVVGVVGGRHGPKSSHYGLRLGMRDEGLGMR
jgi:hypothetical protein